MSYLGTGNLLGIGERTVETHVRSLLKKYHQPKPPFLVGVHDATALNRCAVMRSTDRVMP
ncbi:MAG: response regulator transcription factor [Flavobacteriales bacterium]|nr:response regulator transcription factor [Flavobacteriales bacterium]